MQVVVDRRHVTFMFSYPPCTPMRPKNVRAMQTLLNGYMLKMYLDTPWASTQSGAGERPPISHLSDI
jgi:hypothetical protein